MLRLLSWIGKILFRGGQRAPVVKRRQPWRLAVEILEDRVVPCAPYTWGAGISLMHDHTRAGLDLTQYAHDGDGDPFQIAIVSGPSHGTLTQADNGTYSYTPDPHWTGLESFGFQASDGILA